MSKKLDDKILDEAIDQVTALMREHWDRITAARDVSYDTAMDDGARRFRYSFGMAVVQVPRGQECDVHATISYGVTHKDEAEVVTVDDQPRLDFDGKREHAE